MLALSIFTQNNGERTKAYYAAMNAKGPMGELAVALFRAQKRSLAAKRYTKSEFKHGAYDVKNWSLGEVYRVLRSFEHGFTWGWKYDRSKIGYEHVLYVDLPTGQCSFHSHSRIPDCPDYKGYWIPGDGSTHAILRFCDSVWEPSYAGTDADRKAAIEEGREKLALLNASEVQPEERNECQP